MIEPLAVYWRVFLWCAGVGAIIMGIEAVLAAPYQTGTITTVSMIGGVNLLVNLFDHKAEQRRTAEAREAAAEARGRAAQAEQQATQAQQQATQAQQQASEAERRAEQAEREAAELRRQLAERQNGA